MFSIVLLISLFLFMHHTNETSYHRAVHTIFSPSDLQTAEYNRLQVILIDTLHTIHELYSLPQISPSILQIAGHRNPSKLQHHYDYVLEKQYHYAIEL